MKQPMLNPEDRKVVKNLLLKMGGSFVLVVLFLLFTARHIAGY